MAYMDFVILKVNRFNLFPTFLQLVVNGTDVSNVPHEDAVRAFLAAQEPILVEVKRRIVDSPVAPTDVRNQAVSTAVQTDLAGLAWLDDSSVEECFTHDLDLEEVTLRKCASDEKLGLTVCYSSGSEADTCTEVYIREILPRSVADRDGRLRQGDQILQVNGKDVANKEETESLFAENKKAVTLLVSRCFHQDEEYLGTEFVPEMSSPNTVTRSAAYQNSLIEQLVQQQAEADLQMQQQSLSPKTESAPRIPPHHLGGAFDPAKILNNTNSLVRSQLESIKDEISMLDHRMQNIQLVKLDKRKPPQLPEVPAPPPPESDTEHIYETIPESAESEVEPIYSCPYEANSEQNMVEQWLTNQDSGWTPQPKVRSKSSKSNSSGEEHENSSSAYNTGGSCNSNPLTFELQANLDSKANEVYRSTLVLCPPPEKSDSKQQHNATEKSTATEAINNCEDIRQHKDTTKPKKSKTSNPKVVSPLSPTTRLNSFPHHHTVNHHIISDTMYTNVANLQQTMLLQQQLFRQALNSQNVEVTRPSTSFTAPSLSQYQFVSSQQVYNNCKQSATVDTRMEWKVKRRQDGTRYIARRPVRNRILRNRAIRISEERAGITTEDDTISELKVGRYWTKEERKKQLERARERKHRNEQIVASKSNEECMDLLLFSQQKSGATKKSISYTDTAKKHKVKKTNAKDNFEDFPTVQEMIVHGPKGVPNNGGKLMGLLSVTTV